MPTQCTIPHASENGATHTPPRMLLRGEQVACLLDISLAGLYHLVELGLIPRPRQFGVRARWLVSDLESMLSTLPFKKRRKARPLPDMPYTTQPKAKQPKPTQTKGGGPQKC